MIARAASWTAVARRAHVVAAVLTLFASFAGARLARADTGLAPGELPLATQAARAHYDAGRAYFEQGDLRRAIAELTLAKRDDDRPTLDYDLAVCHERLGHHALAAAHLRSYLARAPPTGERPELEARITAHELLTGELVIRATSADAQLTLDDEPVRAGTLQVDAGLHRVAAAREGFRGESIEVKVEAGARALAEIGCGDRLGGDRRRRRALAIGLGIAGGVVLIGTAVVLGVVFGTRDHTNPYVGSVGVITVNP